MALEILTENDIKWKGVEYYEAQKERLNSPRYSIPWRNVYSRRHISGKCIYICKTLNPVSEEDFYNRAHTLSDSYTKEHLEQIAIQWRKTCMEEEIPLSVFYDVVVCHNIVETFKGCSHEREVKNSLINAGFDILPTSDRDDSKLCVDIIAEKNEIKYLIQVKVISFLFGNKPDLIEDRKKIFTKCIPLQKKIYGNTDYRYAWVFYDYNNNEWILNPETNRFTWDITKIIDYYSYKFPLKDEYIDCFRNKKYRRNTLKL